MRITARVVTQSPNAMTITVMHDDGTVSSPFSLDLCWLTDKLTPQQIQRFFNWSWTSGKSVREEFVDRVISATTHDEENWTLFIKFPGVPGPGVMLPDGSTHT